MSTPVCRRAEEVRRAARDSAWTDELRVHVAGCAACGEEALLASFFAQLASETSDLPPLPDAGSVRLAGLLSLRRARAVRLARALSIATALAWTCGGAAAAVVALRAWPLPGARLAALAGAIPRPAVAWLVASPGSALLAFGAGLLIALLAVGALDPEPAPNVS